MTPEEYISKQEPPRQALLSAIHKAMIKHNKKVKPEVDKMMRQEMIQYKLGGVFMYGLGNGKGHMSLHLLPLYGSPEIYNTYKNLLGKAKFQKGCINFTKADQMPLGIVEDLIKDCAKAQDVVIEMYMARHKK